MLIKCPECGHIMSDKAKHCPECGHPQAQQAPTDSDPSKPSEPDAPKTSQSEPPKTSEPDNSKTKKPHKYKYYYTPKKSHGCRNCLIALLIGMLLVIVVVVGLVFGCVEIISDLVSDGGTTTFVQSEDTTEYTQPTEEEELADVSESADTTDYSPHSATVLQGYIGSPAYAITMTLNITPEGDVSGSYHYDSNPNATATLLLGNYQRPYLTLYETAEADSTAMAYFEGKYDGETFAGSYTNRSRQEYAFTLKTDEP